MEKWKFMKGIIIISWALLLIFHFSCSFAQKSSKKNKKEEKKPAWVTSRPVDKKYYQGIGVAMVNTYTQGHVEEAKKKALQDIISEISVQIKSSSVLEQIEKNDDLNRMYQSVTRLTSENEIEGYELVDSWGDASSYWVYYRLSKELYAQNIARRIGRATSQATVHYTNGNSAIASREFGKAYEAYVKGLVALRDYLDKEIKINTDRGSEYLVDVLMEKITELNRDLQIIASPNQLKARVARPVSTPVQILVTCKGQPVAQLPLRIRFTKGAGEVPASLMTDASGRASVQIQRITGGDQNQLMEIGPDIEGMSAEEEGMGLVAGLIRLQTNVTTAKVNIETTRITATFEASETHFGKPANGELTRAIKNHLSEKAYSFTESENDLDARISVKISATKGEEILLKNVKLYTAYIDCFITITNAATGKQVYYKGFSREKGSRAGGFDQALRDAEDNVMERFRNELLPEINNIDL